MNVNFLTYNSLQLTVLLWNKEIFSTTFLLLCSIKTLRLNYIQPGLPAHEASRRGARFPHKLTEIYGVMLGIDFPLIRSVKSRLSNVSGYQTQMLKTNWSCVDFGIDYLLFFTFYRNSKPNNHLSQERRLNLYVKSLIYWNFGNKLSRPTLWLNCRSNLVLFYLNLTLLLQSCYLSLPDSRRNMSTKLPPHRKGHAQKLRLAALQVAVDTGVLRRIATRSLFYSGTVNGSCKWVIAITSVQRPLYVPLRLDFQKYVRSCAESAYTVMYHDILQ